MSPTWTRPRRFDRNLVVNGAGTAGLVSALVAAKAGATATLGTTQFRLGLLLLTVGSRLISATHASLLANLELPFAPLWVWLDFGELPSRHTFVGGGIVCAAVLLDLVADQMQSYQSAR
jgi:drug/metabolite transporter (DMT)-like permease